MLARHMTRMAAGSRQPAGAPRPCHRPASVVSRPMVVLKAVAEPAADQATLTKPTESPAPDRRSADRRRVGLEKDAGKDGRTVGIMLGRLNDQAEPYIDARDAPYLNRAVKIFRQASSIMATRTEEPRQVVELFIQRRIPSGMHATNTSSSSDTPAAAQATGGDESAKQTSGAGPILRMNATLVAEQLPAVPLTPETGTDLGLVVKVSSASKAPNIQDSIVKRLERHGEAVLEAVGASAVAVTLAAINGATVRVRDVHKKRVVSYVSSFMTTPTSEGVRASSGTRFVVRAGPLRPRKQPTTQ